MWNPSHVFQGRMRYGHRYGFGGLTRADIAVIFVTLGVLIVTIVLTGDGSGERFFSIFLVLFFLEGAIIQWLSKRRRRRNLDRLVRRLEAESRQESSPEGESRTSKGERG